ncbi:response regulator [Pseudonocardia lacus]|uniref:response regulator n=1 Tax=Pseudonocardia lacus TaxID=2835865 RepID=UPI001BDCC33D|nr:response regulator [Pseudonocardia lacus]
MRVLVVEDDPDLAEYAGTVLRRSGDVTVEVACDGRMALESFRARGADILIADIELPGMTGIELATCVRRVDPDMPVAMMTAHATVDYAVSALRNQIDEFLVKPVSAADFRATLLGLIELRTARNAAAVRPVVLAIGAHPDDVEIGVGGLLAAHRAAGDSVIILTLCRGDRGGDAEHRQQESLAAAELIGARLFLEDLVDTKISPSDPTVSIIERVVDEVGPSVVYTHSRHDRHQDHRAVHDAASVATRRVPTLACYQSPSATVDFHPNRFVPIDGYTDTKLALLECFSTQSGIRDYLEPDFVLATARYWSRFGGGTSCEPLEVIRDTRGLIGSGAAEPVRNGRAHADLVTGVVDEIVS